MATTPNGLPYPDPASDPDVPYDMGQLALALDPLKQDTGWQALTLVEGLSGSIRWRCKSGDVEVDCNISGPIPTGASTVTQTGLPAEFRPTGANRRGTGLLNARPEAAFYVTSSTGDVGLVNNTGGARSGGEGTVRYFLG